jgi:hypothetical protein
MDKVTFIETTDEMTGQTLEHAIIDHGDESFTTMSKAEYDRRQAEQSTPSVIDEAEAK